MRNYGFGMQRAVFSLCVSLALAQLACGEEIGMPIEPQPTPTALDPENRDSMTLRLELFVADVQASADFYTGVLGFVLAQDDPSYTVVRAGEVLIALGPYNALPGSHHFQPEIGAQRLGLGTEIVLEVDDVENLYDAVAETGYPISSELQQRPWGLTDFRVVDPDGYYLRPTSR